MKLTRERKIFGAVLLIALGVLGYDQLGRSTPDVDAAASSDALVANEANHGAAHSATLSHANDETSLSERLVMLAGATIPARSSGNAIGEGRDIFRANGTWLMVAGDNDGSHQIDPVRFAQLHKLSTVSISGPNGGVVAVDGKLLHVGATIDGYKLMVIDPKGATFRSADGSQARLTLAAQVAQGQ